MQLEAPASGERATSVTSPTAAAALDAQAQATTLTGAMVVAGAAAVEIEESTRTSARMQPTPMRSMPEAQQWRAASGLAATRVANA